MATIEKRPSKGGTTYRVKIRVKDFPPVTRSFSSSKEADAWAKTTEADMIRGHHVPTGHLRKVLVSDIIERYLAELRTSNPSRYKDALPQLCWWNMEIGSLPVLTLQPEQILKARTKLGSRRTRRSDDSGVPLTLSAATINRYMAALSTALNFGVFPLKLLNENPTRHIKKLKEAKGRTRFLTNDEIERLLAACKNSKNSYLLIIVILGIATGGRRSEISQLRWCDVNADCSRATIFKTKNGETKTLHFGSQAKKLVEALRTSAREDAIFVFPSPTNRERPIHFETAWQHALLTASISDFHFHDLRHTCASYLAMNGASLLEIAEILSHKTLVMVKRYAHLLDSHTSKVVSKMNEKVFENVVL